MKTLIILLSAIMLTITLAAPSVLAGVDRCLSLDGDGDYVDLGVNTFNTLDDFTIETWVRLDEYNASDVTIKSFPHAENQGSDNYANYPLIPLFGREILEGSS